MPVFNYISVEDRWYPNRFGQSKLPVWVFIQTIGDRLWLIMNGSVKRPNRLRPRNKAAHTYLGVLKSEKLEQPKQFFLNKLFKQSGSYIGHILSS